MPSLARILVYQTPARLASLARLWEVVVPPEGSPVASLYREMTDDWSLKRVIGQMEERRRAALYRIAAGRDHAATGAELLRDLPFEREPLEALLRDLREVGLIAIAGLDPPAFAPSLPALAGEGAPAPGPRSAWSGRWTCSVPDDLAAGIRRAREQSLGDDQPERSASSSLAALGLPALRALARCWGISIPDRGAKRELVRVLEQHLGRPDSVAAALESAGGDARRLFECACSAGGRLTLASARERTGLDGPAIRAAWLVLRALCLAGDSYAAHELALVIPAEVLRGESGAAAPNEPTAGRKPSSG